MSPTPSADQPSVASRWRREAVQPLLQAYAADRGVEAVILSGSTARGDADRWSDVEVGVFWATPPDESARGRLASSGGAQECRLFPYDERERVWCDDVHLGSSFGRLLVEVVHTLTASTEQLIQAVTVEHSPDSDGLNAVQGLVDGIASHGSELVEKWKASVASYPRGLAIAVVESAGVIDHFWRWEMLVERRNPVLLAGMLSAVCQQLLTILLALNGRYGPKPKQLDALVGSLTIAPAHLADRMRHVFAVDPPAGSRALAELVEETFTLIERELPEVDIERLRRIFRHSRGPLGPSR